MRQVGRNGTGKTTLLRALAGKHIKGIPPAMQILHVEQEVAGDGRSVLEAVLACDTERSALLQALHPPLPPPRCPPQGGCRFLTHALMMTHIN